MSRTCGGVGSITQGTWSGAAPTCERKLILAQEVQCCGLKNSYLYLLMMVAAHCKIYS